MAQSPVCPDARQLPDLLRRVLPADQAEALAQHLQECPVCGPAADQFLASDPLVADLRTDPGLTDQTDPALIARFKVLAVLVAASEEAGEQTYAHTPPPSQEQTGLAERAPQLETASLDLEETWTFLAPAQQSDEMGRLGSYRVLQALGRGGMGVVFLAEDTQLQRRVALKAMLPALAASESARQRFLREARTAAQVKHDNVVSIYQVGEDQGTPFLAMELLDGESLAARLKREPRPPLPEVLRIGREMAEGLAAAHGAGLIHRDIKPANVWLEGQRARVKILDFGLARAADGPELTQQGAIVGTPAYMAPEQAMGTQVDARCDLFSLGCVLYRMTTGKAVFQREDNIATLLAVATENPRPPREVNPEVPAALSELVMRLLAKDAQRRSDSAREVADILAGMEGDQLPAAPVGKAKPRRRTGAWIAVGLLGVAAAVLAGVMVFRVETPQGAFQVEVADDAVAVAIDRAGGLRIKDSKTGREYQVQARQVQRVPAGEYELVISDQASGLQFSARTFTVRQKDDPARLRVSFVPKAVVKKPDEKIPEKTSEQKPPVRSVNVFDALRREDIPLHELASAGNGDPKKAPAELVAVLGDSRFNGWTEIHQMMFHNDGKELLCNESYKHDSMARWDAQTGQFLGRSLLSWPSPRGKFVLERVPYSMEFRLRAVGSEKALFRRECYCSWAFRPDDGQFAWSQIAEKDPKFAVIELIDLATGKVTAVCAGHKAPFLRLAYHPTEPILASADRTGVVKIWDARTGKEVHSFRLGSGEVGLAFSPKGDRLAWAASYRGIKVWDVATWKVVKEVPDEKVGLIDHVAFSPDGRLLAGCGQQRNGLLIYDLAGDRILHLHQGLPGAWTLCFSPDGKRLASAHWFRWRSRIYLWDIQTGKQLVRAGDDARWPGPSALHPDGRHLLRDDQISAIRVLNLADGREIARLGRGEATSLPEYSSLHFSANGSRLLVRNSQGCKIYATPRAGGPLGQPLRSVAAPISGSTKLPGAALNADGTLLAVAHKDGVAVHKVDSLLSPVELQVGRKPPRVLAIDPQGKRVAVGTSGGAALFDAASGAKLLDLSDFPKQADGLAFDAAGKLVAGTGWEATDLSIWDATTGRLLQRINRTFQGGTVAFSPDGRWIAAFHGGFPASQNQVLVWNILTGERVAEVKVPGKVLRIEFAPDGKHLLTENYNGTVYVLRLAGGPPPRTVGSKADRRAAEAVFALKGSVEVNGDGREVKAAADLPREPFTLTGITLRQTSVTAADLTRIGNCPNLRGLILYSTKISEEGLVHFRECKELNQLNLTGTPVTDAGLAHFRDCTKMQLLQLQNTQVGNAGLVYLGNLRALSTLHLSGTRVTDAGLVHLKNCKKLQTLWLSQTQVGDAGMNHLLGFQDLKRLTLLATKVTAAKVQELRKALPGCRISWDGDKVQAPGTK